MTASEYLMFTLKFLWPLILQSYIEMCVIWYLIAHLFREGNGTPLQYSCLENPMDSGVWQAAIHGVAESDMTEQLHFHIHALEKEMATHPSALAWRIPGTGEPGGLPSTGSHRVGHD